MGPQGDTGPQGLQGPTDADGSNGADGATGTQSPQGPQGPAGPQGAEGPAGPQSPAGPRGATGPQGLPGSGLSGYIRVQGTSTPSDNTAPKAATATCPAGKNAIGGGGVATNAGNGTVSLTASYPSADNVWTVVADRQSGNGSWSLLAWVVCSA